MPLQCSISSSSRRKPFSSSTLTLRAMEIPRQAHGALSMVFAMLVATAAVKAQMDACGADLRTFLPSPFSSSRLHCSPVWNNFILRHWQNQDNIVSIILSATYTSGWVGIGFSNDGKMVGSSAMIGWIDNHGRAYIKQYYLGGQTSSGVKVDRGNLLTTDTPPAVVLYGDNIYLAFQVNFSVQLAQPNIILASSAITPNTFHLAEHDDKTTLSFDFSSGDPVSIYYPYQLKRNHGALAMFGWGILLPLGVIVARYLRHKDPLWYYLHVILQFLGYIIGLAGVVAGTALYNRIHSNFTMHRGLGISVLALGSLQVIAFFLHPNPDSKTRKYWNRYHHWSGRLCLFLAAVNVALGIEIGGANMSWKVIYGAFISVVLITVTFLEIMWNRLAKASTPGFQMSTCSFES